MKLKRRIGLILALMMVASLLFGCTLVTYNVTFDNNYESATVSVKTVKEGDTVTLPAQPTRTGYAFDGWCTDAEGTKAFEATTPITADLKLYAKWKLTASTISSPVGEIPGYSGKASVVINNNVPFFTAAEMTTQVFDRYTALDSLGRCGVAFACIGKEGMPTPNTKGDFSSIRPSGWQSKTYEILGNQTLFNRSHLVGWFLGGDDVNELNIITGTKSMNQTEMLSFENLVGDYVKETKNHVMYRVTPVFVGNELVARGVLMEGKSVEDDGEGVEFCVFCYNAEVGIVIDYATGDSKLENVKLPSVDPNVDANLTKATYVFATSANAKGTALNATSALTLFKSSSSVSTPLLAIDVIKVFNGNGTGGALENTAGLLKMGTSKEKGRLELTFGEGWNVKKIEIKCHDFYKPSEKYPTNTNTVSVNGSAAVLAPYNSSASGEVMTFDLSSPSNVVTINTTNRILIFELTVYFDK